MSESYGSGLPGSGRPGGDDAQGKVETAKQEAGQLKETAAEQVESVAGTAKSEAASVAREAKSQVKDLYAQTQSELRKQAGAQQQRVASGIRSLGEELGSMASSAQTPGLASDLVGQASQRADSVASWLDARDPGSLLEELKSFARRKPGVFIAAAAVAGVVAGRLTRALASNAAEEKEAGASTPSASTSPVPAVAGARTAVDETPLFTQSAASFDEVVGEDYPR